MLNHPTYDQLNQLGLFGMAKSFTETEASAEAGALTHPEWLALLLGREIAYRQDKKLAGRLRYAKLRQQALVEDVDYRAARGLDRPLFQKLVASNWIDAHENLVINALRCRSNGAVRRRNLRPAPPDWRRKELVGLRARL